MAHLESGRIVCKTYIFINNNLLPYKKPTQIRVKESVFLISSFLLFVTITLPTSPVPFFF